MKLTLTVDLDTGEVEDYSLATNGFPWADGETLDELAAKFAEETVDWILWYEFKDQKQPLDEKERELLDGLYSLAGVS